jgi:hypothetical protein
MKRLFVILLYLPLMTTAQRIQQQVWALTEVMYHDVINPPAAARFYAYSLLAGYETLTQLNPSVTRFPQGFRGYPQENYPTPPGTAVNKELAVCYSILETGKLIIPSGYLLEAKQQELLKTFNNVPEAVINSSIVWAKRVAKMIAAYSRTDGYFSLSTRNRYRPMGSEDAWKPTPPEYMAAVEPHWRTVRTFFLDSAQQFRPAAPVKFDKATGSPFYLLAKEVYDAGLTLTDEQKLIANFWDCNPFAVQFQGHMSVGLKKISPGGHWMGITGIVTQQAGTDFSKTLFLHTVVALTLHDAFTSCWDEKYFSNRVRPETVINRYIDEKWKPLLQTPPFPEYSSGHSVISTAAAEVLTQFLGDNVSFVDSTETYIGLPARKFNSFREAAAEARISRLYGGIHFRDAIENGGEQGRRVGEFIIKKLTDNN